MADEQAKSFRLLNLPGEIRSNIYREILCCFDTVVPPPLEIEIRNRGIIPATHSIDTSILRTCRQVHREAYDAMVKTNQLIKVSSIDIDLARLLIGSRLPIVTMDRAIAEQFQGCVMRVDLSVVPGDWVDEPWDSERDWEEDFDEDMHTRPAGTGPQFKFLILWRDWSRFCQMLSVGTASFRRFDTNVKIVITMNAYPEHIPEYKAPITHYFTMQRQANLLGSFGTILRNFRNVFIGGTVDEQLALSTMQAVADRHWTSAGDVIRELRARKHSAEAATGRASLRIYMDTVVLVRCIHGSADFDRLDEGDAAFTAPFAEAYFNILLDACHPILETMRTTEELVDIQAWSRVVYEYLSLAQESVEEFSHIEQGPVYEPTPALLAKLAYSRAVCSRLLGEALPQGQLGSIAQCQRQAMNTIGTAIQLDPTDAEMLAERDRIMAWRFSRSTQGPRPE
jgi:hypothetical protein